MRDRLAAADPAAASSVRIGTIHSLAAAIVRRHWEVLGLPSADLLIADEDDAQSIMEEAVDTSGVAAPGAGSGAEEAAECRKIFVKLCLKNIPRWKENGLTAAAAADPARKCRNATDEDCARVYVAYQDGLAGRGMVDFADLAMLACRALETSEEAADAEMGNVEWLLVDEYQDTNWAQVRLIRFLSLRAAGLTLVGDNDQSLYSWRGSVVRILDRAAEMYPEMAKRGLAIIPLVENRRCTDEVLHHANLVVDYNHRTEPKVLRSGRSGAPPTVAAHPSDKAEARDTVERVAKLISAGAPPEEIAVLGRTAYVLEELARVFATSAIPHHMQNGTRFLERTEVCDVLAYLKLAMRPSLDVSFMRIAARPTRSVGPASVSLVLSIAQSKNVPIYEALALAADGAGLDRPTRNGAERLSRDLESLAAAARSGESSESILRFVMEGTGYADWAYSRKDPPRTLRSSLESLLDMAREQPSFPDFMLGASVLEDPAAAIAPGVHIGTLHGCKGLEWDHVFMVGLEEGVIPNQRSMDEAMEVNDPDDPWETAAAGGVEEERRLFHVGMTRAKQDVHLSYAGLRGAGQRRREGKPSRFFREAELTVAKPRQAPGAPSGNGPKKNQRVNWW
jgi:DNA helicase-2/ATP-dependent DNA helicase PcrA